jgi:membrane dipeptidase
MKMDSALEVKIADLHADTVLEIQGGADLIKGNEHGHVDLHRMKKGKVSILTMACWISSALPKGRAFQEVSALLEKCDEVVEGNPDQFRIIESAAEAVQAIAENKIALLLAIENGHAIENDLRKLEQLRRRRVRYMTVTHSRNLDWAFSSADTVETPGSLTSFGREVIAAMNDLGIIPDVSHVHESTFWEIIKISKKPVIASHSNAAALCPTPRNLTDDQIKAVAGTGGMIGINFFPAFLDRTFLQKQEERCGDLFRELESMELEYMDDLVRKVQAERAFNQKIRTTMQDVQVSMETIVDHLTHMISLAGEDCVGFGSDMDGVPVLPEGIQGCGDYPKLVRAMQKRGIRPEAIEKICYRNFLRVLKDS